MFKKLLLVIALMPLTLFASEQDVIRQAKLKYAAGSYIEALGILDAYISSNAENSAAKKTASDICIDLGEREYAIRNFKNAYDYFKKAVKLSPTHPIANERYWNMKNTMNVSALQNEGGSLQERAAAEAEKDKAAAAEKLKAENAGKTADDDNTTIKKNRTAKVKAVPENLVLEDSYNKRIVQMEERFNKRILDLSAKKPEIQLSSKQIFLNEIFASRTKTMIAIAICILVLVSLIVIIAVLYKLGGKMVKRYRGKNEYEKIFSGKESGGNYNELIKMQNIKEILGNIKSGDVDWQRIKNSMSELGRELRLEVLNLIETKIDRERQPLTMGQADVLMSLILDGDEYLRKRVSFLMKSSYSQSGEMQSLPYSQLQLGYEAPNEHGLQMLPNSGGSLADSSVFGDLNIVMPLSRIVDRKVFKDNHAQRVASDVYYMAGLLGLSSEERNLYYMAGLIHDIGYLDIHSDILNKSTSLTKEEYATITTHTRRGIDLLDFTNLPQTVHDGILYHHEQWSGGGYPEKLKGEDIPLVARVIGLFDMYEALILPRPHRPALPQRDALKTMKKSSGVLFDPKLVTLFEQMLKQNLVSKEDIWAK